jgi:hypothetical protein
VFQVPISDAKDFLRTDGGVQQVLVMLDDYRDADKAADAHQGGAGRTCPAAKSCSCSPGPP